MAELYQCGISLAPFPGGEAIDSIWTDRHTHQPQGRKTDSRGHAPHLAVATLGDGELDPGGRDVAAHADGRIAWPQFWFRNEANVRRAGAAIVEWHAAAQFFQRLCTRRAFDLRPIGLGQFVFRFGNAGLQGPIVGEQQQALAVVVEPSGRAHLRHRNEIGECAPAFLVGELAQDIEWFVEQDEHYSSSVSPCAYGGAQQHRMRSGSVPVLAIQCGVPGGMQIVSPISTSKRSSPSVMHPRPAVMW